MQSHLLFYIVAGLLLVTEAFTPGLFIFVCFAVATLITGLIDQLSNFSLLYLLIVDLVFSVIFLFSVRPLLQKTIKIPSETNPREFGTYSEKLIGREAMVFKIITKFEPGVVKLLDFDETWLARAIDGSEIGQGSLVTIEKIDGNHLLVK